MKTFLKFSESLNASTTVGVADLRGGTLPFLAQTDMDSSPARKSIHFQAASGCVPLAGMAWLELPTLTVCLPFWPFGKTAAPHLNLGASLVKLNTSSVKSEVTPAA